MKSVARIVGLVAVSMVIGTACGPGPAGVVPIKHRDVEERTAARARLMKPLPEAAPATAETAVTGEVPEELLDRIRQDLAERTGAVSDAFGSIRAEAVTWNDGSLGCPRPGVYYTQAPVPGYRVVLSFDGREYDYRASTRGYFMPCPAWAPSPPPAAKQTPR